MTQFTDERSRGNTMTPKVFAQAIASIEQNYGLKLDARSVWLRMDDWKRLGRDQMGQKCGRGWVGLRGACKRVKKGGDKDAAMKESKVALADKIRARKGLSDRNAPKPVVKKAEKEPKSQQPKPQITTAEIANSRRINGKHDDLPDSERGQVSKIRKLTGMSAADAKSSIKAIKNYASMHGDMDGIVSYGAIRNVQRGIFKAADGKPHYGNPLTKAEIAEVQSSIESIDQYVKKMPAFEGVIHRGMFFDSDNGRTDFLSKISQGYSLEAMSSFSSSRTIAEEFAGSSSSRSVIFTVKNKSGASIQQLSGVKKEEEVLVPKGTKYKIVGTPKKIGEVVVVQMEEI